jgi:hypothetical protein
VVADAKERSESLAGYKQRDDINALTATFISIEEPRRRVAGRLLGWVIKPVT